MTLGERIKRILEERNLKQVCFAEDLGVSANYVNQLVNGKKTNISETLAKLIEETYGYSAEWVMLGTGEKITKPTLSNVKVELLKRFQKMSDDEINALLAFANSLDSVRKSLKLDNKKESD